MAMPNVTRQDRIGEVSVETVSTQTMRVTHDPNHTLVFRTTTVQRQSFEVLLEHTHPFHAPQMPAHVHQMPQDVWAPQAPVFAQPVPQDGADGEEEVQPESCTQKALGYVKEAAKTVFFTGVAIASVIAAKHLPKMVVGGAGGFPTFGNFTGSY